MVGSIFASSGNAYVSSHNVNMLRNAKARKGQEEKERKKRGYEIKDQFNFYQIFSNHKVTEQISLKLISIDEFMNSFKISYNREEILIILSDEKMFAIK